MKEIKLTQSNSYYLEKTAQILLKDTSPREELQKAVQAYHLVCSRVTGIQGAILDKSERKETRLPTGYALSTGYAADCTLDSLRTTKYLRALKKAIEKIRENNPSQKVHVLYAGSGPFAPFALPLTRFFSSQELCFTILDIHEQSLDALKQLVSEFSLEAFFKDFITCDATEYQLTGERPHILVTETMHRALAREPHVMITRNLAPQLAEGGIVVPQKVAIRACLTNMDDEQKSFKQTLSIAETAALRIDLGTIFEVTADTKYDFTADGEFIRGKTLELDERVTQKDTLVLLTEITLFEGIQLNERESGITFPYYAHDLGPIQPGDSLEFLFQVRDLPGIRYKVCSELKL